MSKISNIINWKVTTHFDSDWLWLKVVKTSVTVNNSHIGALIRTTLTTHFLLLLLSFLKGYQIQTLLHHWSQVSQLHSVHDHHLHKYHVLSLILNNKITLCLIVFYNSMLPLHIRTLSWEKIKEKGKLHCKFHWLP